MLSALVESFHVLPITPLSAPSGLRAVAEWGGKILEDQQDGVQWAIAQGIADPTRVAVMGGRV